MRSALLYEKEVNLLACVSSDSREQNLIGPDKTYPNEIPRRSAMRKQIMAAAISFQAC